MPRALLALVLLWLAAVPPAMCLCAASDHEHAGSGEPHEPWCPEVTGGDAATPAPTADVPPPPVAPDFRPVDAVSPACVPALPSPRPVPIYLSLGVLRI